jgi:predicted glycoside hydrolase/deacetylase ChbG (UPF0249 family)/putative flippase GtrA
MHPRHSTVTADDIGLSRHTTDTILETVDRGSVTTVSILANGEAFTYAIDECLKRKDRLTLAVHLNLTEGRPLSPPSEVSLLVNKHGAFRYTVSGLWLAYLLSFSRSVFREQVRKELRAQIARVRQAAGDAVTSINGHQHVHMLPFVFDELKSMADVPVRIPSEAFSAPDVFNLILGVLRMPGWLVLSLLTRRAKGVQRFTDAFIGVLHSGRMSLSVTRAALQRTLEHERVQSVEILFHPGSATPDELSDWQATRASVRWYCSSWRSHERALLHSPQFAAIIEKFMAGTLGSPRFLEVIRFVIAGVISTGSNLLLLFLFTDILGLWYIASAITSYLLAIAISFTLQKFWAFAHHSVAHVREEVFWYILNNVFGLVFDAVGLFVLVEYFGMWYMFAQFILLALIATWNFFIYRFVIFRR